jgi:hypothetical protein
VSVFEVVPFEGLRFNEFRVVIEKGREVGKGTGGVKERKKMVEGQIYERNYSLLNFIEDFSTC